MSVTARRSPSQPGPGGLSDWHGHGYRTFRIGLIEPGSEDRTVTVTVDSDVKLV